MKLWHFTDLAFPAQKLFLGPGRILLWNVVHLARHSIRCQKAGWGNYRDTKLLYRISTPLNTFLIKVIRYLRQRNIKPLRCANFRCG